MVALKGKAGNIVCELIFNAFYIVLTATIVFAQLVVLVPRWLKPLPFYKKAVRAVDKIFLLDSGQEFSYPNENIQVKLRVGSVSEGETGFRELLEAIKEYRPIQDMEARTICLAFGDIPIPTSMASPNYALFFEEHGFNKPIYFDPWGSDDPSYIKVILLDWVKRKAQTKIAQYTVIAVVIWIAVLTWRIYG